MTTRLLAALSLATSLCGESTPRAQAAAPLASTAPTSCEDTWLAARKLNEYGDPPGTNYAGGTPLFDERTGKSKDRREYLLAKWPALRAACAKDGG